MGQLKFGLRFSTRVCEGCGGKRLAANPCPDCKRAAAVHEVDPEVQRRCRVAVDLKGVLRAEPTAGMPANMDEFMELAQDTISSFLTALKPVATSDGGLERARSAVRDVARLAAWSTWEAPRPYRSVWRDLSAVGPEMSKSADLWIEVHGSATMLEAQQRAEEAQAHLDAVAVHASRSRNELDELSLVVDSDATQMLRLASEIALRRYSRETGEDVSLIAVDTFGRERLARVVGDARHVEPGVGLALLWMTVIGEVLLDDRRLYQVARTAYGMLTKSNGLAAVVRQADWQAKQREAMIAVRRIMSMLENMSGSADEPETAARAALPAVQDLVHRPMRHVLATLLAANRRQTYGAFASRDGADMLKQYGQLVDTMAIGSAEALRNASAHSDYIVDPQGVTLDPHGCTLRLTWAELDDGVLESLETVIALCLAVICAMTIEGLADEGPASLEDAGVTLSDTLVATLMMGGWTDVTVSIGGDRCTVKAAGAIASVLPLVAAIGVGLPESVELIHVDLADGDRHRTLIVPTAGLRVRRATAHEDDELSMAEYMMSIRLDGETFMTPVAFRHLIAMRVGSALGLEYSAFVREARRHRAAAQRVEDEHLVRLVGSVLEIRRCQELDAAPSDQAKRDLDEFAQLERIRVPEPYSL